MIDAKSISLDHVHAVLGWNTPDEIMHPSGAGASVFAALAREKIGRALTHHPDAVDVRIGVLMSNAQNDGTEPPIALVTEFPRSISDATLRELHRFAWNFSHCPTLITIEPGILRAWSCCEAPDANRPLTEYTVHQITSDQLIGHDVLQDRATMAMHWINLVSGTFFLEHAGRFDRDGRADQTLLGNLRYIRSSLAQEGLDDDDICHDLLARIIFVQFLFDRKDADGVPALTPSKLAKLQTEGVLGKLHTSFDSVLSDYHDTYRLFDWLNTRFNGDLFPGKGATQSDRAEGWAKEKRVVTKHHLALLAEFIRGNVNMPSGQRSLWPQYSFDVIPLEFISSIYETFVTSRAANSGVFYTPPHLVDFVLDCVLPWKSTNWDIKVIDPACGSGIFLVKAFQRLVHRWKLANPDQPVRAELLRRLLERNIFGVDLDPHAVRVACFSLYLAMCDEIEPRHYWTQVVFPSMRGRRLIWSDFFDENISGFSSHNDAEAYDLVVGNAPWGEQLITPMASSWASDVSHRWTIANKDLGGLFLAKAMHLLKKTGRTAMIQSANALLFNGSDKAIAFRKELFNRHRVEEIINLSALRFGVFKRKTHTTKTSISPACIVILNCEEVTQSSRISYVSPKRLKPLVDDFTIVIEPNDRRFLTAREAAVDPIIWTTLMWGNTRDRLLLRKLQAFPTLKSLVATGEVTVRQGVIYGDRGSPVPSLTGRPFFSLKNFPDESSLYLDTDHLPAANDVRVHSKDSTNFSAFSWPQMIIKKGLQISTLRFQARIARSSKQQAALFNDNYVSVSGTQPILDVACASFNSALAVYYFQLTSGRIAAYRPAALVKELLSLPLPEPRQGFLDGIGNRAELDSKVFDAFQLRDAERALIEDMLKYTVPDFRKQESSDAQFPLIASESRPDGAQMKAYCHYVIRVLNAGFGHDKIIRATIFQPPQNEALPYQLVAFSLGGGKESTIEIASITALDLLKELERLDHLQTANKQYRKGIYSERSVRIYDSTHGVPVIFVVKPNEIRHWTRTAGLTDGDDMALDLFRWRQSSQVEAN